MGLSHLDDKALVSFLKRIKEKKNIPPIIEHYFVLDGLSDDFPNFKTNGHDIQTMLRYCDKIWASFCSSTNQSFEERYVVAYTVDGEPVFRTKNEKWVHNVEPKLWRGR